MKTHRYLGEGGAENEEEGEPLPFPSHNLPLPTKGNNWNGERTKWLMTRRKDAMFIGKVNDKILCRNNGEKTRQRIKWLDLQSDFKNPVFQFCHYMVFNRKLYHLWLLWQTVNTPTNFKWIWLLFVFEVGPPPFTLIGCLVYTQTILPTKSVILYCIFFFIMKFWMSGA